MNVSKVSFPASTMINIYYYFSYFTLFTTWLITPILFYIILTQSKKLKSFKWFIFNHSIWCFAFENFLGLVKPLYLCPAPSGFPLGMLKDGNPYLTGLVTVMGFLFVSNCVIGVFATIINRYLFLFPSRLTKNLNKKLVLAILGVLLVIFYGILIYSFGLTLLTHIDSTFKNAIEFDPIFFKDFYIPSFFFLPLEYAMKFFTFGIILLAFFLLSGIGIMAFFIYHVKRQKSETTEKFQQSLIITSIMQILLTCMFLLLPMILIGSCIVFQIPHSSGMACLFFTFLSFHSCLEFAAIMYYVTPYRKFIYQQWANLGGNFRQITVASSAVGVSSTPLT